jgi:hypothetical protein
MIINVKINSVGVTQVFIENWKLYPQMNPEVMHRQLLWSFSADPSKQ